MIERLEATLTKYNELETELTELKGEEQLWKIYPLNRFLQIQAKTFLIG